MRPQRSFILAGLFFSLSMLGVSELAGSDPAANAILSGAPTLAQPENMTVAEGAMADQTLNATDPDNQVLRFAKVSGPVFLTVSTLPIGTGTVHLAPLYMDSGLHDATVRVTDGALFDTKSFSITVIDVNRAPTAIARGPYLGTVGEAIVFDGAHSSDPDGDALAYLWSLGDGATASGPFPSHAYASTGSFPVALTVSDGFLADTDETTAEIGGSLPARAYFFGGNRVTRLGTAKPSTCVQVEPGGEDFSPSDIDPTSIVMSYAGNRIPAVRGKLVVLVDFDLNGVPEIEACFMKEDLRILFAGLPPGDNLVDVVIEGRLVDGAPFSATATHRVIVGGKKPPAITVSPNPFNPETAIAFSTTRAGRVTARIYDLSGRLVRTLEDRTLPGGAHALRWNGSTDGGGGAASGIYFLQILSPDGDAVQRLVLTR